MTDILIIGKDKGFASAIAEQVKAELSLACRLADTAAAAKEFAASAALVITAEPGAKYPCPAIAIKPPVRLQQLLAEIAGALQKASGDSVVLGRGYVLHPRQKKIERAGKAADLTDKEAQLLQCLAEAGSKGVVKEQLLKNVWGIEAVLDTHTLETHIYRLRGKLRSLSDNDMIEAMENGYKRV
jgi:hypothetical protein